MNFYIRLTLNALTFKSGFLYLAYEVFLLKSWDCIKLPILKRLGERDLFTISIHLFRVNTTYSSCKLLNKTIKTTERKSKLSSGHSLPFIYLFNILGDLFYLDVRIRNVGFSRFPILQTYDHQFYQSASRYIVAGKCCYEQYLKQHVLINFQF